MDGNQPSNLAPKIQGLSTPVGSSTSRKQESPAERANAINQSRTPATSTAPKQRTQAIPRPAVTQEEIDNFRKNRKRDHKLTVFFLALAIIAIGALAYFILCNIKDKKYAESATLYSDNTPIVVSENGKSFLIDQKGNKLSEGYDFIAEFESDTTLAMNHGDANTSYILGKDGKSLFQTESTLLQSLDNKNYILTEGSDSYLLDNSGKKVSDLKLYDYQTTNYEYALVHSDNKIKIIDSEGEEKFSRVIDNFEVTNFTYAKSRYEDNNYCAIAYRSDDTNTVIVYNCETQKVVKQIDNASTYADFYDEATPMLQINGSYYYFYNNDVLFYSESPSTEIIAGIIQTTNEEGNTVYFDPKNKNLVEDFPEHNLIAQNNFDTTTKVGPECETYEKSESQDLTKICEHIYNGNKLLDLNYEKYDYSFLPQELAKYLEYLDKHYIVRRDKATGIDSIYDYKEGKIVKDLEKVNFIYNTSAKSSFVQINQGSKNKYYNLATGQTLEADSTSTVKLGANYLAVQNGNEITYYNKEAKEIYRTKGEQ